MAEKTGTARLHWKDSILILVIIAALAAAFWFQAAAAAPVANDAELRRTLDDAAKHFQQEDYAGARDRYQRAAQLDPGSLPAWRGLGGSLWRLGKEEQALKIWDDIGKVAPDDPDTLLALAQVRESHEDWSGAEDLYAHVLRVSNRNVAALVGRGRIRQRIERYGDAEADLRRAIAVAPDNFEAQYLLALNLKATGREDEAQRIFTRIAGRRVDRPEEALEYYRRAPPRSADNRGTVLGMARAEGRLGQYAPAMAQLQRYVEKHPDDAAMREQLVRFASASGEYARAIEHLQVLIAQQPDETRWRVALARAQRDAGDTGEAVNLANAVLKDDPKNPGALELLLQVSMIGGTREETMTRLEALTNADPTVRRLVRLGNEYLRLGDGYAEARRDADALAARKHAADAYRRAIEADPQDADAVLGAATALRLSGDARGALKMARAVAEKYPANERARRERYESYLALDEYRPAHRLLVDWRKEDPQTLRLREDYDRTRFHIGEQDKAVADLHELLGAVKQGVPVLLYHGLSVGAPADDTMPLKNFEDQMKALSEAGYRTIDMRDLLAFYRKGAKVADLPKQAVMITFDDARSDSFRYADPVLKRYGFHATMFTPTNEVGRHGDYNATWSTIRRMARTGRWDIQCHSHAAHSLIPVDASGRGGIFLANRMWLDAQQRLETQEEFIARLDGDYRQCRTVLQQQVPGMDVAGYAYPFGELGQKSLSNEPDAVAINTQLVTRYYKVGFIQDDNYETTRLSREERIERFEVPWDFSGRELIHKLHELDAYSSTQLLLAELYSWDGRYARANQILDQVSSSGRSDDAAVLTQRGRMTLWQGNYAGARDFLAAAAELEPRSSDARESIADLDRRTRPQLTIDGEGSHDNRDRDVLEAGPAQKLFVTDRLSLTAGYRYLHYADNAFDMRKLDPASTAPPASLRATGNEYDGEIAYRRDWRTGIAISGGVASFQDNSSTALSASEPEKTSIAAIAGDIALGENAEVSVQGKRGYVEAAGAVLTNLKQRTIGARGQFRPLRDSAFIGALDNIRYDDGNARRTLTASALQRIVHGPDLKIGYRFRYDDTNRVNPFFYSPDRFMGHDVVAQLDAELGGASHVTLETAVGRGHEHGGEWKIETSVLAQGRWQWTPHWGAYLNGGYNQAADYSAVEALAGFALTF